MHALYRFFFILCMSHEGINHLRNYLSCEDQKVFHPLFIAQYLFIPINTIVNKYLLKMFFANTPEHKICGKDGKLLKKHRARRLKAKIYLQYILLDEILGIVKNMEEMTNTTFPRMTGCPKYYKEVMVSTLLMTKDRIHFYLTASWQFG